MLNKVVNVHNLRAEEHRDASHKIQEEGHQRLLLLVVAPKDELMRQGLEVGKREQGQVNHDEEGQCDDRHGH